MREWCAVPVVWLTARACRLHYADSEDRSVRVWDLRGKGRSVRYIGGMFEGEASCVAYHPTSPHRLFAASGRSVYEFDLRRPDVLLREAAVAAPESAADDINHLILDSSGDFVVLADDAGCLHVMDTEEAVVIQTITAHESLAACVVFSGAGELVSGGYDATIRIRCVLTTRACGCAAVWAFLAPMSHVPNPLRACPVTLWMARCWKP